MTTAETPHDGILATISIKAMAEAERAGLDHEEQVAAGGRALFTAGERRVLTRLSAQVRDLLPNIGSSKRPGALWVLSLIEAQLAVRLDPGLLESLRDAPAATQAEECGVCKGLGSGRAGGCSACNGTGRVPNEPPAKPEATSKTETTAKPDAAGEEPAIVCNLRSLQRAYAEDPSGKANDPLAYGLGWDELDELLAWLDRPAPAAKEAGELSPGERALVERIETLCLKAWEHEAAQLRAKVQDFEAWARNTAHQAGWGGGSTFDAFDYLDSERDRLRARVAELEHDLCEANQSEALDGGHQRECTCGQHEELLHPPQPTEQRPDPRAAK